MTPEQAKAIARLSGCTVRASQPIAPASDGSPRWAFDVRCPTYAAKVKLLQNLSLWDGGKLFVEIAGVDEYSHRRGEVRDVAMSVASDGSDVERVEALLRYVQRRVKWVDEPQEIFGGTLDTLEWGAGDCDDSARAIGALLTAAGYRTRMATLGKPPRHVAAQVFLFGRWYWVEASIPAELGEHPTAAIRRLGPAYEYRKDIAP